MSEIPEHLRRRAEAARARNTIEQVPCVGSGLDGHYQGQGRVMCPACGAILGIESNSSRRVVGHNHWTVEHLLKDSSD